MHHSTEHPCVENFEHINVDIDSKYSSFEPINGNGITLPPAACRCRNGSCFMVHLAPALVAMEWPVGGLVGADGRAATRSARSMLG